MCDVSVFVSKGLYRSAKLFPDISIKSTKLIKIAIPELEKNFLKRFRSFSLKGLPRYQEITLPNDMRVEHSLDIC